MNESPIIYLRALKGACQFISIIHFTAEFLTMEDSLADRTAAIDLEQADAQEPSKNALKKAAKQKKLAEEKANKSATSTVKEAGKASAKKAAHPTSKAKIEGAAQIGIDVAKEVDFSGWYSQVLIKGHMLDHYDVSGCYILRVRTSPVAYRAVADNFQPNTCFIWREIQKWFTEKIESIGVEECYFPMFVSQEVLEREKDHIEGFSAEVAWVMMA